MNKTQKNRNTYNQQTIPLLRPKFLQQNKLQQFVKPQLQQQNQTQQFGKPQQ